MTPKEAKTLVKKWNRRTKAVWDPPTYHWVVVLQGARYVRQIAFGVTEGEAWVNAAKALSGT